MCARAVLRAVVLAALAVACRGKTLSTCQLVDQLVQHDIARCLLSDWVCLSIHESALNTSAVGGTNKNGSYDFGIFQINSRYWCGLDGRAGDCNIKCSDLIDDDLDDDIACAKIIYSQRGFYAWNAWKSKCKGKPLPDVSHCFSTTTETATTGATATTDDTLTMTTM